MKGGGSLSEMDDRLKEIEKKQRMIMKYAKSMMNAPLDNIVSKGQRDKFIKKYSKEDIEMYLASPKKYESKLREVVDYLCSISPQFQRLIEYIPNMAYIAPFVKQNIKSYKDGKKSTKTDKIKKDFDTICDYYDTLDVKNTSNKILKEVFKYGIYYGVEIQGVYKNYIKRLNPNYCRIISEGELGLGGAFDCSYFNGKQTLLDTSYPKEFKKMYTNYQNGNKIYENLDAKWQPIPLEISVIIKYDLTNLEYSIPPYVSVFADLYDLDEYKSLNKAKVTAENYTLIGLKIPTKTNATKEDDFAISNDMVDMTSMQLESSLPPYMGYFTHANDIDVIKASSSDSNSVNNVANAEKNLWNAFGYAECMFGVDNTNSGTLQYAIKTDEEQLFGLYRQLESYWGLKIKKKNKNFKFILLNTTWFNIDKWIENIMSSAQVSIPVAQILPILLGFDISDIEDMNDMQELIFDIQNKWRPLASSYTQSSLDNETGRPESEEGLTESGDKTRENESNTKR